MFGLSRDGFKRKRMTDLQNELKGKWKEQFGENSNVESGVNAKLITLMSWGLSGVWQLAEKVYNSGFIFQSEGRSLDGLMSNLLLKRRPAETATGTIAITGEAGTEVQEGFLVSNGDNQYVTTETVTIGTDGTATAEVTAEEAGSDGNAPAGSLTEIVTPLVGVDSVTNPSPISGGRDEETDDEFKRRYELSRSTGNSPSANGIRAEVLGVEGVRTATVIENLSITEDADGRPGRSYETFVLGGDRQDIAQAIFKRRAAGTRPYGLETVNIVDASGNTVPIGFTLANEVAITFNITLQTNNAFPADGNEQVRTALIQYIGGLDADGNEYTGLGMGQDVIYTKLVSIVHSIAGVEEVTTLEVNTGTVNIAIDRQQVAVTDYNKVVIA